MSFPQVAAVNGGYSDSLITDHTVNLPAGIVVGNLLLVFFATFGQPTATFPEGWTQLFVGTSSMRFWCYYRIADGTEGSTITVSINSAQRSAHTSYGITGFSGIPEAGVATTGGTASPNPPSLAPSWGSKDTLWFACCGSQSRAVTVYPTNFTGGRNDKNYFMLGVGTARRELNAASEDPGVFTLQATAYWVANVIAIKPSNVGFHSATAQRRYRAATFSTFVFPDPAGSGFTSANDGYYMLAGLGKSGILTAEGLGVSKLNFRLNPSGITTSETIPNPQLGSRLHLSGIGSAEAFGTAFVKKMLQILLATSIPTAEAFGTAFVKKMLQILSITAIPTAEAFGTTIVAKMLQFIIPSGVASSQAFGTVKIRFYIAAPGIISQEIFGAAKVNFRIRPSGIISQQAFGVAKVNRWVFPSGIISQAAFGNAKFIIFVRPSGIATLQAFGVPIVEKIILLLRPAGILSNELFGTVIVVTAIMLPPVRLKRPPRLLNALRNLPSDREDGIRRMP